MLSERYCYIFLFCLLTLGSCTDKKKEDQKEEKVHATEVALSTKQVKTNGITFGSPEMKLMSREIVASGNVDVPPQFRALVTMAVGGFVKSAKVLEGDHVHRGDVLAVLTHPDYVQIQQQYLEALSRQVLLKKELERQEYLREENVNAKKDLERIQSEMKINEAQVKAIEAKLGILGLNPAHVADGKISSEIQVRSPLDGDVTMVNITLGKFVRAEEPIFEVISKDHLHLELHVYEHDVLKVKPGQHVKYFVGNNEEDQRMAKVILVGKKLDLSTRTVSVHAHPEGDTEGILPGMYVKAKILTEQKETPALPEEAIVREGDKNFVFVEKSKDSSRVVFEKIPVTIGASQNDSLEVKLPSGDWTGRIVMKGTYYLSGEMKKPEEED